MTHRSCFCRGEGVIAEPVSCIAVSIGQEGVLFESVGLEGAVIGQDCVLPVEVSRQH